MVWDVDISSQKAEKLRILPWMHLYGEGGVAVFDFRWNFEILWPLIALTSN
jgi:hypothetical protein